MRNLSILATFLVGIFCLAASSVLASGADATPSAVQLLQTPAASPPAPPFLTSGHCSKNQNSSSDKSAQCDPGVPTCNPRWNGADCYGYCEEVFTGLVLQMVCSAGCCECQDVG